MKPAARLLLALGFFVILVLSTAVAQDGDECYGKRNGNCDEGFELCQDMCCDINECEKIDCGPQAVCVNQCGNYSCICIGGFMSKSVFRNYTENNCEDIDECQKNASICEPYGSCINVKGDYHCKCKLGFKKSAKDDKKLCRDVNECNENPCDQTAWCKNLPGTYQCICPAGHLEYNDAVRGGENTTKCKEISIPALSRDDCADGQGFLGLLDVVMSQMENESKKQRHRAATVVMKSAEDFLRVLAFVLPSGPIASSSKAIELAMEIRGAGNQSQSPSPARLLQNETEMELNWEAASKGGEAFSMVALLTYKGLEPMLSGARVEGKEWEQVGKSPQEVETVDKPSYKIISRVAAAFVGHNETQLLRSPVTVSFNHHPPDSDREAKVICAFWKPVNGSGWWSEEGCTRLNSSTATRTRCQCTHLTSFAVLMAFYDVENQGLEIITKVGLIVSLVCLFLSILTFLFSRAIRGIRTTIHLHLCLALFAADVIFLLGAGNPSNKIACAVVAGLLHYFFLSVFCWMLLEGMELYLMVVQVFKTHSLKHWHIFLVGYGLPAVLVGISAAINSKGYGNKNCWLARDGGFLWSFLGPVSFIIMVNAIVFVITVWKLSEKFADINPDMSKLKKQRVLTVTAIAQLCILGTTWIFGMFQFSDHTLVMSYIFTILNSLQGLFIFLLHCLLKKQVRDDYYRCFCKLNKGHSSDKYSDFSSTAGSNTLRAQKSFRESGM